MKNEIETEAAESASLWFNDLHLGGSSDKVYNLHLVQTNDGWSVTGEYGRRGSALQSQTKIQQATYANAKKVFDKKKREQLGKGYVLVNGPATQLSKVPEQTQAALPPELLEEITTLHGPNSFLTDPAYMMQDKSDGVSRGVVKQGSEIFGINKKAQPVPLPAEIVADLSLIKLDRFQIDAELVGNTLICRDLLVANEDITQLPYEERFNRLCDVLEEIEPSTRVRVVETWCTANEKRAALVVAKEERREGVVFKLRTARYRAGRSGSHKKYKFIKTLSAIAGEPGKSGKQSVQVFLLDPKGKKVRAGTVCLIGKPAVKEGDVLECAYLYGMPSGLMFQARLLQIRTDVAAEECVTSQLIMKREIEEENP